MADPFAMSLSAAALLDRGWPDVVRCVADAHARNLALDTLLILLGPPRAIARIAPIQTCGCDACAFGVMRADFIRGMKHALTRPDLARETRAWTRRVLRDLEAPLADGDLRILIAYESGGVTVASTQAPKVVPIAGAHHVH